MGAGRAPQSHPSTAMISERATPSSTRQQLLDLVRGLLHEEQAPPGLDVHKLE